MTKRFEIIDTLEIIQHLDGVHETHIQLCSDFKVRAQLKVIQGVNSCSQEIRGALNAHQPN